MRKLTATVLSTSLLVLGVGAGSALASPDRNPAHHADRSSLTDRASRQGHRERSSERAHTSVDRAHGDREAGRTR